MAVIYWPGFFCPMTPLIAPISRSVLGPATLTGAQQAASSSAGAWKVSFDGIPLHTDARIEIWRALEILIEGRVNQIVVPLNQRGASVPMLSVGATSQTVTHSDGAAFNDASEYWQSDAASDLMADASMGDTTVLMSATMVSDLRPGMMFSVAHRLYRIKSVAIVGSIATVGIWPPLRDDLFSGDQAEFKTLSCTMRLASDDEMSTPLLLGKTGVASVDFIEDTL